MPPQTPIQEQNNQVPPVPPVSSAPTQSQAPASSPVFSAPQFSPEALMKNTKFIETVKTFAIYGGILGVVNYLLSSIISTSDYSVHFNSFSIMALVFGIIGSVIGSAIGGVIFYFVYEPVKNWIKGNSFLSKHINSLFTLFWKPFLFFTVIGAVLSLLGMLGMGGFVLSFAGLFGAGFVLSAFVGWAIGLVVHIAVYYFYSKSVSEKLAPLYPW